MQLTKCLATVLSLGALAAAVPALTESTQPSLARGGGMADRVEPNEVNVETERGFAYTLPVDAVVAAFGNPATPSQPARSVSVALKVSSESEVAAPMQKFIQQVQQALKQNGSLRFVVKGSKKFKMPANIERQLRGLVAREEAYSQTSDLKDEWEDSTPPARRIVTVSAAQGVREASG